MTLLQSRVIVICSPAASANLLPVSDIRAIETACHHRLCSKPAELCGWSQLELKHVSVGCSVGHEYGREGAGECLGPCFCDSKVNDCFDAGSSKVLLTERTDNLCHHRITHLASIDGAVVCDDSLVANFVVDHNANDRALPCLMKVLLCLGLSAASTAAWPQISWVMGECASVACTLFKPIASSRIGNHRIVQTLTK